MSKKLFSFPLPFVLGFSASCLPAFCCVTRVVKRFTSDEYKERILSLLVFLSSSHFQVRSSSESTSDKATTPLLQPLLHNFHIFHISSHTKYPTTTPQSTKQPKWQQFHPPSPKEPARHLPLAGFPSLTVEAVLVRLRSYPSPLFLHIPKPPTHLISPSPLPFSSAPPPSQNIPSSRPSLTTPSRQHRRLHLRRRPSNPRDADPEIRHVHYRPRRKRKHDQEQ